jgi:hypothetical protein
MGADQDGRREIPTWAPEDVEGTSHLDQVKDDFGGEEWHAMQVFSLGAGYVERCSQKGPR